MIGPSRMDLLAVAFGFLLGIAGVYTILNRGEVWETVRRVRARGYTPRIQNRIDPKRIPEMRHSVWIAGLLGLIFIAGGLAPSPALRYLIVSSSLLVPVLYIVVTVPLRENLPLILVLASGAGYGLLVAIQAAPGVFLIPVGLLFAGYALLEGLSSTPTSESTTSQQTFRYQCVQCKHVFESDVIRMTDATCPNCRSRRVVSVAKDF